MVHALSSSVAQFSLLSLSFFFTEVAVLSVSHAVIVSFGGCSAWLTLSCNASSGRLYVSSAPDLCLLLDFTLESENPALNRVVQQVTLPEWFVIFLFSKGEWQQPETSPSFCLTTCWFQLVEHWIWYFYHYLYSLKVFCSNMDFYSVLYVRKVQFTNCLCMTHENFMY